MIQKHNILTTIGRHIAAWMFLLDLDGVLSQTALPVPEQRSIYSANCQLILDSCPFAQTACVSNYCSGAPNTDLGSCDSGNLCCGKSNAQTCLVSANIQDACNNIQNSVVLCPTATAAQASCLCGAGSSFATEASKCAALVSQGSHTSMASFLSGSRGLLGYCAQLGGQTPITPSVSSGVASPSASTTSRSLTMGGSTTTRTTAAPTSTQSSKAPPVQKADLRVYGVVAAGSCLMLHYLGLITN